MTDELHLRAGGGADLADQARGEIVQAQTQSPVLAMMADPEQVARLPVEKFERMFDLFEREQKRVAEIGFNTAFLNAKREMPPVPMTGENETINSRYARLDDVLATANPVMQRHGFTFSVSHGDSPVEGHLRFVLRLRHVDGHSEKHYWDSPPDQTNRAKTAMMAAASATSYAERQLLLKVWGLQTAPDLDGQRFDVGERITEGHAAQLRIMLAEADRTEAQYCRTMRVKSIDDLLEREYERSVKSIQRVIDQRTPF